MPNPRSTVGPLFLRSPEIRSLEGRVTILELKFGQIGGPTGPKGADGATGPPGSPGNSVLNVPPMNVAADSPVAVPSDLTAWTYYSADTTAGDVEYDLPPAVGSGMVLLFSKEDDSANKVIVSGNLINNLPTLEIAKLNSVVWITDRGPGAWKIINVTPMA